ncbi:MAG: DUF4143 domain-containing protein, partial [Coprobacillus sp.]|nr:DUF4143 domain-containing protein [Coprobacillus sp.]
SYTSRWLGYLYKRQYLEDAFIIKKVDRYDIRGNKYMTAQSKYYFTDLGIRNAILNFRQMGDSRSLENLVYNELVIQGYSVDIGMISSYKSKKGPTSLEVDFIARKYDRLYYIQVSSYLDEEKYLQESASLKEINDAFKKIIICKEGVSESHYSEDGILLLSLTDFLLDEKSLNI